MDPMKLLVNIDVDDLDQAITFYCGALGLTVGRRLGAGSVELLGASSAIHLLLNDEGTSPSALTDQKRSYERHWCPVHLDFVVTDIESAVQRAVVAGAILERPIQAAEWGRLALLVDPFGHGLCLVQFLGDGYDAPVSSSKKITQDRRRL